MIFVLNAQSAIAINVQIKMTWWSVNSVTMGIIRLVISNALNVRVTVINA